MTVDEALAYVGKYSTGKSMVPEDWDALRVLAAELQRFREREREREPLVRKVIDVFMQASVGSEVVDAVNELVGWEQAHKQPAAPPKAAG